MLSIRQDDLSSHETRALIAYHRADMRDNSPPSHSFALDLTGLQTPDVTVWTAWDGEEVAGMCALKQHDAVRGELKSMRTHPGHLRKGVAAALLEHVIAQARARGLRLLSLETGSGPAFDPALRLYRRRGFKDGEAFGDYQASDFNQFLHLAL
jgi:putative acetyltransferase